MRRRGAVEAGVGQQPRVVRGHAHEHGCVRQPADDLGGVEPVHEQDATARGQRAVERDEQPRDVDQRQDVQQRILGGEAPFAHQRLGASGEIGV